MKCSVCGKSESKGAHFCGSCGAEFASIPGVEKAVEKGLARDPQATIEELPMVGFPEAVRRGFKNYFNFHGRATRAEYWWWTLFSGAYELAFVVIALMIQFATDTDFPLPLLVLWGAGLSILIPSLALGARRLHDVNRSGWWHLGLIGYVLFFVPGFLFQLLLMYWAVQIGDAYPNKYGPDPRSVTSR